MILLFILSYGLCFCRQFTGVSSAFLHQYGKDGYNTFDDTSTIFPSHNSITGPKWNEPYFDNSVGNNVTSLVGKSAYMSCRVRNLGNKTVSNYHRFDIYQMECIRAGKIRLKTGFALQLIGHRIR